MNTRKYSIIITVFKKDINETIKNDISFDIDCRALNNYEI